jgi:hypothetical protein
VGALLAECSKEFESDPSPALLLKSWTHSYEENTSESIDIYRPSDYKDFAVSRFRQVYDFREDNICYYLVLSPIDAHYMAEGKWSYQAAGPKVKIMDADGAVVHELEIMELTVDLLRTKR